MSKKILTAEELISSCKTEEQEFKIGTGIIKIQGLTKGKTQSLRKQATINGEIDADLFERFLFKEGIIEPELTDEQLNELIKTIPSSLFDDICYAIMDLSGLDTKQAQEAQKFFRA